MKVTLLLQLTRHGRQALTRRGLSFTRGRARVTVDGIIGFISPAPWPSILPRRSRPSR